MKKDKEIERLNNIIKNQQEDIEEYNDKLNEVVKERNKYLHIINELEKELFIKKEFYERELTIRPKNDSEYNTQYADSCALAQINVIYNKLQKLKGSEVNETNK